MSMHNKYIFYILVANVLWSFTPILASDLIQSTSILMIILLRFLLSGIVLFLIGLIIVLYNNRYTSKQNISLSGVFSFLWAKNRAFNNLRNLLYLFLLGFIGIFLHIFGYFLTLKLTSISFAMIGFQLTIIIIAFYEHGVRLEKLDLFKMLYLLILIFCIFIIMFVNLQLPSQTLGSISFISIIYLILFSICLTFFLVGIDKDSYTKDEIMILNKNPTYKIVRMLIKISFIFFFALISMFPFTFIFYLFPIEINLFEEITYFLSQFDIIFSLLLNWEMIILIIFSTMVPYILLFIANLNWNPYNLTYGQWNSVLTVIEPTFALLFGVLFVREYFPVEYLIIVIFLLTISILFRYAHEAHNKINAYILLTNRQKTFQTLPIKLLQFDGVKSVQALVGTYDLLLNVKTTSIRALYYLINERLRKLEGIEEIEILFIDKIIKI